MSIGVRCPGCAKKVKAKDELAGKRVKCPSCGQAVVLPSVHTSSQLEATSPPAEKMPPASKTPSPAAPTLTASAALPSKSALFTLLGTLVGFFSASVAGAFSGGCVMLIGCAVAGGSLLLALGCA